MKICVDCRRLTEACEPGHRVVEPTDQALVEAVWQDGPRRRERFAGPIRAAFAGAGVTFAVCAVVVLGFQLLFGEVGGAGFWIFLAVLAAIAVPAVFVEQLREHGGTFGRLGRWLLGLRRLRPRGAPSLPVPSVVHGRGRAIGEPSVVAPLSNRRCLAYAVELEDEGEVFLRVAEAGAFQIEEEDGVIEVPAGPIDLGPGFFAFTRDATAFRARLVAETACPDPIPTRRGREITLQPGDPVELLSELSVSVDPDDGASGYRAPPRVVRRPIGRLFLQGQALPPKRR